MSPAGQPLASFLDRFLAYLIDAAVLIGVLFVLFIPALIVFLVAVVPDATDTGAEPNAWEFFVPLLLLELVLFALSLAFTYVYYVELMFRTGQTLGKKVLKIKIVPLDPAIAALSRLVAAKRYLAQHIAGTFVPFYSYVDGLWQLWDKPYQQCLHDKFAQTVVVKVPAQ